MVVLLITIRATSRAFQEELGYESNLVVGVTHRRGDPNRRRVGIRRLAVEGSRPSPQTPPPRRRRGPPPGGGRRGRAWGNNGAITDRASRAIQQRRRLLPARRRDRRRRACRLVLSYTGHQRPY